jgi:tRNA(Ile)-lysidine synthase
VFNLRHFNKKIAVALESLLPDLQGRKLGIAVSGGPDSVALLAAMVSIASVRELFLLVLHVNHGLRPEADAEQQLVESLCQRWRISYRVEKLTPPVTQSGIEIWARTARYHFFERVRNEQQLDAVAVAHTRDDQAETVLFRFLRGSARRGLAGIPPIRDGWIVRPLLGCSRQEILQYLNIQQIPFVIDPSNADTRYTRNKIRHQLLPLLERDFSSQVRDHLVNMADAFREEETWLETAATAALERVRESARQLSLLQLMKEPKALHTRILRQWIEQHPAIHDLMFFHLTRVRNCTIHSAPSAVDLPGGMSVVRKGLSLFLEEKQQRLHQLQEYPPYSYFLTPGQTLDLLQSGWRVSLSAPLVWKGPQSAARSENLWRALFDADACPRWLVVRNFQPGDRIAPLGLGKQKKVHDVFIDAKVPVKLRRILPLVAIDDLLAWVPGCVRGEVAKVSTTTRRVYQAEVIPLPEK